MLRIVLSVVATVLKLCNVQLNYVVPYCDKTYSTCLAFSYATYFIGKMIPFIVSGFVN